MSARTSAASRSPAPSAVCRCHRSQDRRPDSIDQGSGGRTVGVSALGNADHALTLYLLKQAGADAQKVQFATMGVNLLEALRQGQIDVGLVQEPALTLLRARARACS